MLAINFVDSILCSFYGLTNSKFVILLLLLWIPQDTVLSDYEYNYIGEIVETWLHCNNNEVCNTTYTMRILLVLYTDIFFINRSLMHTKLKIWL